MARHLLLIDDDVDGGGIDPHADDAVGKRAGHAIAVALQMNEPGGRHAHRMLDVAIKGFGQGIVSNVRFD